VGVAVLVPRLIYLRHEDWVLDDGKELALVGPGEDECDKPLGKVARLVDAMNHKLPVVEIAQCGLDGLLDRGQGAQRSSSGSSVEMDLGERKRGCYGVDQPG
jgi:hypothetical protein